MNPDNYSITTLVVKHLPDFITSSTELRSKYFAKYNPLGVRFMDSPAMLGFAFLDFPNRDTAERVYEELKRINFGLYYKQIKVEYAKPDHNRKVEYKNIPTAESIEPISRPLGVLYSSNPHLKYYYPDPTPEILSNMTNAIGTVPRLYNQVLHLMNKLNMPPPFGPVQKESMPNILKKRKRDELLASDESELEEEEEDQEKKRLIQEEKIKEARLIRLAAEKQKLALQKTKEKSGLKQNQTGIPSKKLYIKNLSKKTTEEDLHTVYSAFSSDVHIQLMKKGKLREQAFITLPDVEIATKALESTQGYVLHDKPMVIQFGRES